MFSLVLNFKLVCVCYRLRALMYCLAIFLLHICFEHHTLGMNIEREVNKVMQLKEKKNVKFSMDPIVNKQKCLAS